MTPDTMGQVRAALEKARLDVQFSRAMSAQDWIDEAIYLLDQLPEGEGGSSRAVPRSADGWLLTEPTAEMLFAGAEAITKEYCDHREWEDAKDVIEGLDLECIWRAMSAAAPKPPILGTAREPHPSNEQMIAELCEALLILRGSRKWHRLELSSGQWDKVNAVLAKAQSRGEA